MTQLVLFVTSMKRTLNQVVSDKMHGRIFINKDLWCRFVNHRSPTNGFEINATMHDTMFSNLPAFIRSADDWCNYSDLTK